MKAQGGLTTKKPSRKRKELNCHLTALIYNLILPSCDLRKGCQHKVLDFLYKNDSVGEYCIACTNCGTEPVQGLEPFCCKHCAHHPPMLCCDLCDPDHTNKMYATDPAPKSTCNPNKIKIDENGKLTPLDAELEHKLKEF